MEIFDKTWWLEHGATYKSEVEAGKHGPAEAYRAQELALVKILDKLDYDSVLEIGAGFGRLTAHLAGTALEYRATDVSEDVLESLKEKKLPVTTSILDLDTYRPTTPEFDLILCAEVLMHRTNQQAIKDVNNMLLNAKKYVVLVDWYEPGFKGESPGCYQHYWGSASLIQIPEARQGIWVFMKEQDAKEKII